MNANEASKRTDGFSHSRRISTSLFILYLALVGWVGTAPSRAAGSESVVVTNTLPPVAGYYQLWPPTNLVRFQGSSIYHGTNAAWDGMVLPFQFDLQAITAGDFTNITRTISGNDQVVDFDALMGTKLPYILLGTNELTQVGLDHQAGHFRIRIKERALRSTGRFDLVVEDFSWTFRTHDNAGVYSDFIHVQLQKSVASTGWINVESLTGGRFALQSEIVMNPEGAIVMVDTNYVSPVTGSFRLNLRGTARDLRILLGNLVCQNGATNQFELYNSDLGTNYLYGLDYTTNGFDWVGYVGTNFWGQPQTWYEYRDLETWFDTSVGTPMKLFRLKAYKYR